MKKFFLLLLIGVFAFSCSKDDCKQDASCVLVKSAHKTNSSKSSNKVYVCHNGNTLHINVNALQAHLNHGDTEGECETLSDNGLVFADGEIVQIDCKYELPFMHIKDNGEQWFYDNP